MRHPPDVPGEDFDPSHSGDLDLSKKLTAFKFGTEVKTGSFVSGDDKNGWLS